MDRGERERLIALISWGRIVTTARFGDGDAQRLILRPATPEDNALAAVAYEEALQQALDSEAMTHAEALEFYASIGTWTAKDEEQLKGIQDDIHKMRRGLLDYLFQVEKLENIRSTIRRAEKAVMDRFIKKMECLSETAEQFALMASQRAVVGRITLTAEGQRYWPAQQDFDTYEDVALVGHLSNIYFGSSRLPEVTMRELARTEPWRTHWNSAKHANTPLFPGAVVEWSWNQIDLARWSHLYDIVYESMERPSEQVIEDDDLLDSWLIRQSEQVAGQTKQKESESLLGPGSKRQVGRNETFVMADAEGAKRVYDMNDPHSRQVVRQIQKLVTGKDVVKETELPVAQRQMREQLMAMRTKSISER